MFLSQSLSVEYYRMIMRRREKYDFLIAYFQQNMPDAQTELVYRNAYELLVAVILSAQCTDKRVNQVTPAFFDRYPDIASLAKAKAAEVFPFIRSISYPNNKAKYLADLGAILMEKYDGQIPQSVKELQTLPGVGRKTANVITSVLFAQPNMAVDTHVFRVAHRLGLVAATDTTPLKVERTLLRYLPEQLIHKAHHWLILHGRYICLARRPQCAQCAFTDFCAHYKKYGTE